MQKILLRLHRKQNHRDLQVSFQPVCQKGTVLKKSTEQNAALKQTVHQIGTRLLKTAFKMQSHPTNSHICIQMCMAGENLHALMPADTQFPQQ